MDMTFTCLLLAVYWYLDQRDGDSKEIGGAVYVREIARRQHHLSRRNISSLEKVVL
jgi:hypothetical protein